MTPSDMVLRVSVSRGVAVSKMRGPSRVASVVRARHEAMFILRHVTELSFPEIGRLFGGRDHSTAIHAYRKIAGEAEARPSYEEELMSLVRPVHVERLDCMSVVCSGCIPERRAA